MQISRKTYVEILNILKTFDSKQMEVDVITMANDICNLIENEWVTTPVIKEETFAEAHERIVEVAMKPGINSLGQVNRKWEFTPVGRKVTSGMWDAGAN